MCLSPFHFLNVIVSTQCRLYKVTLKAKGTQRNFVTPSPYTISLLHALLWTAVFYIFLGPRSDLVLMLGTVFKHVVSDSVVPSSFCTYSIHSITFCSDV